MLRAGPSSSSRDLPCDLPHEFRLIAVWCVRQQGSAHPYGFALTALVKTRLKRMQYRPGLIDGFITKTRLDFSLP
jgi:hypothetical protein